MDAFGIMQAIMMMLLGVRMYNNDFEHAAVSPRFDASRAGPDGSALCMAVQVD